MCGFRWSLSVNLRWPVFTFWACSSSLFKPACSFVLREWDGPPLGAQGRHWAPFERSSSREETSGTKNVCSLFSLCFGPRFVRKIGQHLPAHGFVDFPEAHPCRSSGDLEIANKLGSTLRRHLLPYRDTSYHTETPTTRQRDLPPYRDTSYHTKTPPTIQ